MSVDEYLLDSAFSVVQRRLYATVFFDMFHECTDNRIRRFGKPIRDGSFGNSGVFAVPSITVQHDKKLYIWAKSKNRVLHLLSLY